MRVLKNFNLYTLLFIVFCYLSYRDFILSNDFSVIGHNWDWSFPGIPFLFERIYLLSTYTWFNFNLGSGLFLNISHFLPNSLVSLAAHFVSIKTTILMLFVLVNCFSYFSFKKLADYLSERSVHNYIPALLYAFSPFLLNEIIGGSWYMWISYAFAPLFSLSLSRFVESSRIRYLILFLSSGIFVISSLQNFVMLEFILLAILFIHRKISIFAPFSASVRNYIFAHLVLIIFNSYWLLPLTYSLRGLFSAVSASSFTGNFASHYTSTQNLQSIFSIIGYLDRNMYYHILPEQIIAIFWFCIFVFWLLVIVTAVDKRSNSTYLPWYILLYLVFSFVAKGGNPPFGDFTVSLYRSVLLFSLYRSIQHTMFSVAFLTPLLMCFVINGKYIKERKSRYVLTLLIIVSVWTIGWWYRGDLGTKILSAKNRDHIDTYSIDPDFTELLSKTQSDDFGRVLFLPTVLSPVYIGSQFQNSAQGGIPEYIYLKNPTFSAEASVAANIIDTAFCTDNYSNWFNMLAVTNVKYILLRKDVVPIHTVCGKRFLWDVTKIEGTLAKDSRIKLIDTKNDFSLYEVNSSNVMPPVYVPSSIDTSAATFKELAQLQSLRPDTVYVDSFKFSEGDYKLDFTPDIVAKKTSPVQYDITLSNVSNSFILVLGEAYDPGWKVYPKIDASILKRFLMSIALSKTSHFSANGYANAWYIDVSEYCMNVQCDNKKDTSQTLELTVFYWPQLLLYIGWFITGVFTLIILVVLVLQETGSNLVKMSRRTR